MRPHRLCRRSFVFKTQSALQYGSFQHQYKLSQKNNRYQDLQTVSSSSSSLYHTIHVCVEPRLLSHPPPKPAANECVGFVLTADAGLYIVLWNWISANHMAGSEAGHHMATHQSLSGCYRGWREVRRCHINNGWLSVQFNLPAQHPKYEASSSDYSILEEVRHIDQGSTGITSSGLMPKQIIINQRD